MRKVLFNEKNVDLFAEKRIYYVDDIITKIMMFPGRFQCEGIKLSLEYIIN